MGWNFSKDLKEIVRGKKNEIQATQMINFQTDLLELKIQQKQDEIAIEEQKQEISKKESEISALKSDIKTLTESQQAQGQWLKIFFS